MTKGINYIRRYGPDEKPYGSYENMFVFTGDSRKRNINEVCLRTYETKETNAFIFQRYIKYGCIEDDYEAFQKMNNDREKAAAFFATLSKNRLLKELPTPEDYQGELKTWQCKTWQPETVPTKDDFNNIGWVDPFDSCVRSFDCPDTTDTTDKETCVEPSSEKKKWSKIGTCATKVWFYRITESNSNLKVDCLTDLYEKVVEEQDPRYIILGFMQAYARPFEENLHLHIGHSYNPDCPSTEQADVKEGGYEFIFTNKLQLFSIEGVPQIPEPQIPVQEVPDNCDSISTPNVTLDHERMVYGDYWVSFSCTDPLKIHFESDCVELSLVFGIHPLTKDNCAPKPHKLEPKVCTPFYSNQMGTTKKLEYVRLIDFESNCKKSYGMAQGSEITIVDECFIRKHIRTILTFPCAQYKQPKNPEVCEFCVDLCPVAFNCKATGIATVKLDKRGAILSWNITYKDLTSPIIKGYFFDSKDCKPILDIGKHSCEYNNPIIGSVDLHNVFDNECYLQEAICDLESEKWCISLHTECNPSGELRGVVELNEEYLKPKKTCYTECEKPKASTFNFKFVEPTKCAPQPKYPPKPKCTSRNTKNSIYQYEEEEEEEDEEEEEEEDEDEEDEEEDEEDCETKCKSYFGSCKKVKDVCDCCNN